MMGNKPEGWDEVLTDLIVFGRNHEDSDIILKQKFNIGVSELSYHERKDSLLRVNEQAEKMGCDYGEQGGKL